MKTLSDEQYKQLTEALNTALEHIQCTIEEENWGADLSKVERKDPDGEDTNLGAALRDRRIVRAAFEMLQGL